MATDEEIWKLFVKMYQENSDKIGSVQADKQAAIRLWRMAEKEHILCPLCEKTACSHSRKDENEHMEKMIAKARADERAKWLKELQRYEDMEMGVAIDCAKHEEDARADERRKTITKCISIIQAGVITGTIMKQIEELEKLKASESAELASVGASKSEPQKIATNSALENAKRKVKQ